MRIVAALAVAVSFPLAAAAPTMAQADQARRQEMEDLLRERYRLTLIGEGALGLTGERSSIRRAGTVVALRRGGLEGSTEPEQPASFAIRGDRAEHYRGRQDTPLGPGEQFYVHSIRVGSDVVTFGLLSSRRVVGAGPLWLAMSFFFPKEVVEQGNMNAIYPVLDQWLQPQGGFQGSSAPPAVEAVPVGPAELKAGMSREEVVAKLGPPRREVSFGSRAWLQYGALVVALEDGRLAGVDTSIVPPAKVTVISEPEGAEILVDGAFVGSTPATLELPPRDYAIRVRLAGYPEWKRDLRVLSGSEVTLRPRLEK